MTDREMVGRIQQGEYQLKQDLWERYIKLVHKNWHILKKQLQESSHIMNAEDDYYMEAYIAFEKTLQAVDLSAVYNDKWKFLGYFRLYLKNVRSSMINEIINTVQHEQAISITTEDGEISRTDLSEILVEKSSWQDNPESIYIMNQGQELVDDAVDYCFRYWDEKQKLIYKLRLDGVLKQDIAKQLGITPSTLTYHMNKMRDDLEDAMGL